MILILVGILLYFFCSFVKVEQGNNIWLFPWSTQNFKKSRGGYKIILLSLAIVSDAILKSFSLLSQKVLALSLRFNRFPIPFGG